MSHINLLVKKRSADLKPKTIRKQGGVPASITMPHQNSESVIVNAKDLQKLLSLGHDSALVYLTLDDQKIEIPVLFDEIQKDGMSGQVIHVAFKKVSLSQKVKAEIPLEFVGDIEIPNGVVIKVLEFVEVEALPTDLPENISVDMSVLSSIGDSILLKDLKIDHDKIQLVLGDAGLEAPVVLVQETKIEPIEEVVETPETLVKGVPASEPVEAAEKADKSEKTG